MPAMLITEAKKFAIEHHGSQQYGIFPYSKHLQDVDNVMIRFGLIHEIELRAAAWLHDILEDTTTVKLVDVQQKFGTEVANLVYAVTDALGRNRKERKQLMYEKLKLYQSAFPIKLADRIANIEWCLLTNISLLRMYLKEHKEFEGHLRDGATNIIMWNHLDYLVDLGQFAVKRADKRL